MLVLTRKTDEQILIGNDIKITLVRVRGNSVRIGIEAPQEVRVIRSELADTLATDDTVDPPSKGQMPSTTLASSTGNRLANVHCATAIASPPTGPRVFSGTVRRDGTDVCLSPTTLAQFVQAR